MFGIDNIVYARMVDTAQHLLLVKKLGKGVWGGGICCGFFKIFTKYGPDALSKGWGKAGVYRETVQAGTKKAGGALCPAGLNFKCQPTNSYLLEQ